MQSNEVWGGFLCCFLSENRTEFLQAFFAYSHFVNYNVISKCLKCKTMFILNNDNYNYSKNINKTCEN